ncbi:hypothetical protein EJ076_29545 [Mesorhizobium sp. M7D.F.Ca.US.005.01.1.1]|uniref:hypothetical protein n=1 Tax=Mesorhizobium sp. M7D.F.Ca.US.005.01.1.1 TaxID=2493678 RepID=UPI000F74CCDB|nr:hypothetical protein [Mesorhizobium sp. M7D.F.Ca.US.005.01.1.1]AZO44952.1 hypothetical protein EJ076_29545 [Mesorhizobium sp. M7D.F.Ca.US.005.01.1.1]
MTNENTQNWICDGEKYALLGLNIKADEAGFADEQISPELAVVTKAAFKVPAHWREWLGSIRAEEVEDCDVFILSRLISKQSGVLDAENQALQAKVWSFYRGLLLTSRFATAHKPVILTGSREENEIGVRQTQDLDAPVSCVFRGYPEVSQEELRQAAGLVVQLAKIGGIAKGDSHWRLFRVLHLYISTRSERDLLHRFHQYARCVDGFVLSRPGKGASDFVTRTELFIGPGHQDMLGEIYADRSSVEHLHEDRLLEPFERAKRLDLLKKEAVIEYVARTALNRILANEALWPHFANRAGLADFWSLPADERQRTWGSPINPLDALAEFDPKHIHDSELGA